MMIKTLVSCSQLMQASERMIDGPRGVSSPPTEDRGFQDVRCAATSNVKIGQRLMEAMLLLLKI
jgi:hypothetical protein